MMLYLRHRFEHNPNRASPAYGNAKIAISAQSSAHYCTFHSHRRDQKSRKGQESRRGQAGRTRQTGPTCPNRPTAPTYDFTRSGVRPLVTPRQVLIFLRAVITS